jgi:hypothetical protein
MDRMVRSHVIYEAIALEGVVEQIITTHFCQEELRDYGFSRYCFEGEISFKNKIRILRTLLKTCYPDIRERVPLLPGKLDRIRQLRNKFAHSALSLKENRLAEEDRLGVFLLAINHGEETQEFISIESINELMKQIGNPHIHGLRLARDRKES